MYGTRIEEWRNPKGNTALVALGFEDSGREVVIQYITNNTRLRSLKSFNHFGGKIAEYSSKNWEEQVKLYLTRESKKLSKAS